MENEGEAKSLLVRSLELRRQQMVVRYVATGAVLLLFTIFVFRGWGLVKGFDQDRFAAELKSKGASALPDLQQQLDRLATTLIPLYLDEVVSQSEHRLPKLQEHLDQEMGALGNSLVALLDNRMSNFRDDLESIVETSLKQNYPDLAKDPAGLAKAKLHVVAEFESVAGAALQKRVQGPATDFKKILLAASKLANDAELERNARGGAQLQPETGVVVSLMGVLGRKLVEERETIIKAAKE